jgi:hypothetical protein
MQAPPYLCNVCGAPKLDTNHWLVAIVKPGFEGILFQPVEATETPRNPEFEYEELCGHACAHKRLSRYLDDLKTVFFNLEPEGKAA